MKIKVIADSGCDLNKELRRSNDISLVPLSIKIEEREYRDDEDLNTDDLLKCMKESAVVPQTASPSPLDFMKEYEGGESVFVVTLSSALSSTYNHAILAKDMFVERYGKRFIHVFDSLSASVGETLVSLKILELVKNNCSSEEIVEKVNHYIDEMKTYFVLESLENLIKCGRINKLTAKIATVLSIKPIMGGTEKGTIKLVEKVRGTKKAIHRLIELIGEQGERLEDKILGIAHCNCLEKAERIKAEVQKRYRFKDIIIVEAGGITTVYANEGGIVIAF